MNEQKFGKSIAQLLDQSTDETIKQSTLYRLQLARQAALEQCESSVKLINSGRNISAYGKHGRYLTVGKLLLLLTVIYILMNITLTQLFEHENKAAIDTLILADDLPLDAYIDNEFEKWLDID
ncbi:DUF3619 family protein [Nitrosomonas supralitoralis]|uniref:DUF3619 family protein n=1 Tax=Nitrosomonas supralitoralis TaxID=2116706 RepID=UPI0015585360|nr:DUF3619 family protein [Nitrosomonas supralitoralis]